MMRAGVYAETPRNRLGARSIRAFRAIGVQYALVRASFVSLIIPGSWVRAPPAPPALLCLLTSRMDAEGWLHDERKLIDAED